MEPFEMREIWSLINPWTFAALALVLSPLAAHLGGMWGWTVGAASLAVLAVPTCLSALTGHRKAAVATAIIASCGCILEAGFLLGHDDSQPDFGFAMLSVGVLLGLSGMIIGVIEPLQSELHRLGQQASDYVRDLYQRGRDETGQVAVTPISSKGTQGGVTGTDASDFPAGVKDLDRKAGDEGVNHPMLLLTLQDVGRRIAGHLDLDLLIPTIIATANHLLKCKRCQIYLWNPQTNTLRTIATNTQSRDQGFVPSPDCGVGRWVLEKRQIITRRDVERDYNLQWLLEEEPQLPDAVAPLCTGGELLGLLVLDGVEQDTTNFARLLYILTDISSLAIKNAQLFKRIEDMARRDGLTGLLNHASFQEMLRATTAVADSEQRALTIIMCDVDHFKKFNDTFGHQAGDHVLRETARLWLAVMPDYAIVARYGGEEFICALPHDDALKGAELAEMLRAQLESFPLFFEGQELRVTASFGVAELNKSARTTQELIRLADEAMYRAKKSGRNRVCVSHAPHAITANNQGGRLADETDSLAASSFN